MKEKIPVGVFSLEMSKEQLVDLMLASQSDVDAWKITTGNLKEEDFEKREEIKKSFIESFLKNIENFVRRFLEIF